MVQQFIVEGKDGYVLSALCEKGGLGMPLGYTKRSYKDFVVNAGGIANITEAIRTTLEDEDVTNIGVVVDANDVGFASRYVGIAGAIKEIFPQLTPNIESSRQGWTRELKPGLTFGLWVMPDNSSPGYLEHFLTRLIEPTDESLRLAKKFFSETKSSEAVRFTQVKDQKALLSLFLAIQEEPGMNAQTAIKKGLLKHDHPLAQNFLAWFAATFQLQVR